MHRFEIWAPIVKSIAVQVGEISYPMVGPDDEGWWHADVGSAGPGTDYGFLVDDGPTPYPDPRSQWQPSGVHGLSRIYDQEQFGWSDQLFRASPLSSAIIYELHIGTFTEVGTFDSAIERLDYLKELGVTHVELMPVASFAGERGWGYDGVALFSVQESYGGPDGLKRFVDAAHRRGMSVLLDVVYNHFGPAGNYTGKYGPYLTDSHKTPWGGAVNLEEAGSHQVRRFLFDNALMWMRDYHIDGLRIDAVHSFIDRSAIHFLEQLAIETETLGATLGRTLVLIAESDLNDPRIVASRESCGYGLDAQWSDDFHHALATVLSREEPSGYYADFGTLGHLAKAIEETFIYDGIYSKFRNRVHGRPVRGLSQHRFIGFIQNHDQVGNRAVGDRISDFVGIDRAKIAAAFVLLGPFIPMIFEGEEWAASTPFQYFADHDPELARLVTEGRKREFAAFGWDPSILPDPEKEETFLRSKLKWEERSEPIHDQMLAWYRQLIRLRRCSPSLNYGEPGNASVKFSEEKKWLYMRRGSLLVACNIASDAQYLPIGGKAEIVHASKSEVQVDGLNVKLPPDSVAILKVDPHAY